MPERTLSLLSLKKTFISRSNPISLTKLSESRPFLNLSSKEILENKDLNEDSSKTKELIVYLLASYLRYVALVWGSTGGVYLAGSIVNTLVKEEVYQTFREAFESSETMQVLLKAIPLILVKVDDIGFRGALELSKKL